MHLVQLGGVETHMAKVKKVKSAKKSKPERSAKKTTAKVKRPEPKVSKPSKPSKPAKSSSESKAESKPRPIGPPKNLSADMLQIRGRLVTMLSDMRKDIEHEVRGASDRDAAHINDTSDMATDTAEGDLALRIAESETVEASEIERAIEKVDNGTYGICEVCNKAIGSDRLLFLPYVTMCIKCQELAEIRKREDGDELDDLAEGTDDSDNG